MNEIFGSFQKEFNALEKMLSELLCWRLSL